MKKLQRQFLSSLSACDKEISNDTDDNDSQQARSAGSSLSNVSDYAIGDSFDLVGYWLDFLKFKNGAEPDQELF